MVQQRIIPYLWFDDQAEEAAQTYAGLFRGGRIGTVSRYGREGAEVHGQPEGKVMVAEMELDGFRINAMNGGPVFRPNPSISFFAQVEERDEVDRLWAGLVEGGTVMMPLEAWPWTPRYGWLQDRFGVSWQISQGRREDVGQAIAPCLMFTGAVAGRAEEAMKVYGSVFPGSQVDGIMRHEGTGGEVAGTVAHAQIRLGGETLMLMDSAIPHGFGFTEGVSLMVSCDTQAEIDRLWAALTAQGGAESMCGWLKDKFGVSWQITPGSLPRLMAGPQGGRVMEAMLKMRKLDLAALEAAAA